MSNIITTNQTLNEKATKQIVAIEKELKSIQEREKELKQALLKEMKDRGVKKIDTPEFIITYIEPTDRENFDKKKFQKDNPDLYDEYVSFSKVKESIRIKLK